MLSENIKSHRKSKGLSQEEMASKLNVTRQTLSKWENGLSVPDAEMLIRIADVLGVPVSTLLGENNAPEMQEPASTIAAKLEVLNEQYAKQQEQKRKIWRTISIALTVVGGFFLAERVFSAVTMFRVMTNSFSDANSAQIAYSYPAADSSQVASVGLPASAYVTLIWMSLRMILPPAVLTVLGVVGICKTKKR